MRTSNSIKNSMTAVIQSLVVMIIGFISQAIFIKILGAEYLGLNGLFTNVLSMLSIFELGIGNAIVYNLYKPIAENNTNEIIPLMNFYKKAYNIIAVLIFTFGMALIPFLPIIVKNVTANVNITAIYILFLLSTVSSYFLIYKRSLLYAHQKNYIINIVHTMYVILLNIFQLLIIYITHNYYLYLIVKIICQILENIVLNIISNKMYPYLKSKDKSKLDKNTEKNIFNKVKALFYHKIASILVLSTDNIIISSFFGVIVVGYYSNYNMIITAVSTLAAQVINSSVASIGNLLVTEKREKTFEVFRKIRFLNFWLACVTGTCIFTIMQPFITLWIGKEFLLSFNVLIVLTINYYQKLMRRSFAAFKDASGTWEEDKYVPLIESVLNIGLSIVFLKLFGLMGVFLGTIVSGLVLWLYSYPKFVYKKLFNRNYLNYACETLGYILTFILIATMTYFVSTLFTFDSAILKVVVNTIIAAVISNALLIIVFAKTYSFKYYIELIKKIYNTKIRKKKIIKN